MCKNEAVRCGLEREKSEAGAARGLIPTHVKEAEWKHEVSSVHLVFPPKLEPCVFDLLPKYFSSRPKLFCVVTKHVRILFSQAPFLIYGCYIEGQPAPHRILHPFQSYFLHHR